MMTKEQMDTLIGRLKVYGSESGRGKDHPNAIACRAAASVINEQQAEIERLRGELQAALAYFDHHGITGGSVETTRALLLGATQ